MIFIIIIIAQVNIIKIYIKNSHFIDTTLLEPSLKYSIFSPAYRLVKRFLINLLVTNQSGTLLQ